MAAETRADTVPAWQRGKVASWLVTTDHKRIGILYIWPALVFFALAGLMALVLRPQLAKPNEGVLSPQHYNELVTIHGTAMIFLVVVPMLAGVRQLPRAAHDRRARRRVPAAERALVLALPPRRHRAHALASSRRAARRRRAGRRYPPLSESTPGHGQDLWILSLHILSASSLAGAINFLVTIHNMRAPGMSWTRHPALRLVDRDLRVDARWSILPVLSAGLTLLLLDRGISFAAWDVQTHFFNPAKGGAAAPLPARVLVLRPPRGLRDHPAGLRDHLRGPAGLRAEADLRLQGDRALDGRDRRSSRCSCGRTTCSRSACRPRCRRSS